MKQSKQLFMCYPETKHRLPAVLALHSLHIYFVDWRQADVA